MRIFYFATQVKEIDSKFFVHFRLPYLKKRKTLSVGNQHNQHMAEKL